MLFLLVLGSIASPLTAQNCQSILNEAKVLFDDNKLQQALQKLLDTELCDYKEALQQEVQELRTQIFKAIDHQRIKAEASAKAVQLSAKKVQESDNQTKIALQKAQVALDSVRKLLGDLSKANADKVRLILGDVARDQKELDFDAAVDKIKTAKILQALPDSVNMAYRSLSSVLLRHARENLQQKDYLLAFEKIKSAGELNSQPDSVAAANEALEYFLFENSRLDIMNTDYDAAVEKINTLKSLGVSVDTVVGLYFECAFCYSEVGRLDRAAYLISTIARLRNNNTKSNFAQSLVEKAAPQQVPLLREAMQQLDMQEYNSLIARYFPPITVQIPMGTTTINAAGNSKKDDCQFTTNAFLIGARELSFYEFDLFCAATKRHKSSDNGWGRGSRPVIDITWYDAVAYCNWRSRKENLQAVYEFDSEHATKVFCNWAANGYRLPTEAEWAFAAGNGEKNTLYSWGNAAPGKQGGGNVADEMTRADFPDWQIFEGYSDGFAFTAPTGAFKPNDFGLYDMGGNVWEWCWDTYKEDYCHTQKNKKAIKGDESGMDRVLRGGSWGSFPEDCQLSRRFHNQPGTRNYSIGFRLARN